MDDINQLKERILAGGRLSDEEAYGLMNIDSASLLAAAEAITCALAPRHFDSCSIINARSGRCSEDCKWCAQSAHHKTGCEVYPLVSREQCLAEAAHNARGGVGRFSMVASGRKMSGESLKKVCAMLREIKETLPISTCASLGLLNKEELEQLAAVGVKRYHCNLETAPSHFPSLCSTHSIDDKLRTIAAARAAGMEICSGGIIGMGETERQRVEFALTLRVVDPVSIPINILSPIPGTPLENAEPLTEDEILRTVAIFRLVNPTKQLRFAGGRNALSREAQLRAMRIGINGAITGDMLTTAGSTIASDTRLASEAGYEW